MRRWHHKESEGSQFWISHLILPEEFKLTLMVCLSKGSNTYTAKSWLSDEAFSTERIDLCGHRSMNSIVAKTLEEAQEQIVLHTKSLLSVLSNEL